MRSTGLEGEFLSWEDALYEGRRGLSGEADRVELLGIDRWLGGTHLRPGHVWRWDPAARPVVRG
jgi:hypothetical protein